MCRVLIYLISIIMFVGYISEECLASKQTTLENIIRLSQNDFIISDKTKIIDNYFYFISEQGTTYNSSNIPPNIITNLYKYSLIMFPAIEMRKANAESVITKLLSLKELYKLKVQASDTIAPRNNKTQQVAGWVTTCDLKDKYINMTATNVSYLELVCRLAKKLNWKLVY